MTVYGQVKARVSAICNIIGWGGRESKPRRNKLVLDKSLKMVYI